MPDFFNYKKANAVNDVNPARRTTTAKIRIHKPWSIGKSTKEVIRMKTELERPKKFKVKIMS